MAESPKDKQLLGLTVADQVVWTASNVLLNALVARSTSDSGFGRFSLGYLLVTITVVVAVAATIETLNSRSELRDDPALLYAAAVPRLREVVGVTIVLGGVGAALMWFVGSSAIGLVLLVGLPVFALQECGRSLGLAMGKAKTVLLADSMWLAIQVAGYLILLTFLEPAMAAASAWLLGAFVSMCVLMLKTRPSIPTPDPSPDSHYSRRDGLANALDYLVAGGSTLLVTILVGVLVSDSALAQVRTLQIAFGPVNMTIAALRIIGVRFVADRRASRSPAMAISIFAWIVTSVVVVFLPRNIGSFFFGESWVSATWILVAVIIARLGAVLMVWPALRLRRAGHFAGLTGLRLRSLIVLAIAAVVTWWIWGAIAMLVVALTGVTVLPMFGAWVLALGSKEESVETSAA